MTNHSLSQGLIVNALTPAAQQLGLQLSVHCAKYHVLCGEFHCVISGVKDLPRHLLLAVHNAMQIRCSAD